MKKDLDLDLKYWIVFKYLKFLTINFKIVFRIYFSNSINLKKQLKKYL